MRAQAALQAHIEESSSATLGRMRPVADEAPALDDGADDMAPGATARPLTSRALCGQENF